MKIKVLGSGSSGNSTYLEIANKKILIDVGLSCRQIEERLNTINIKGQEIDKIFITHLHDDHIKGLKVFQNKYKTKVYIPKEFEEGLKDINNLIVCEPELQIDDLKITRFSISHDVKCFGFVFEDKQDSLVYITDTGYLNKKIYPMIKNKKMYIIEANHEPEMVMNNPKYPHYIKIRIIGDEGHLSNKECAKTLGKIVGKDTKYVVLAHLSKENNCEKLAFDIISSKIKDVKILVANQEIGTELIEI